PPPSSGRPTPATAWPTPRCTCTAGSASTSITPCTATSSRPSTTSWPSAAPPRSSCGSATPSARLHVLLESGGVPAEAVTHALEHHGPQGTAQQFLGVVEGSGAGRFQPLD